MSISKGFANKLCIALFVKKSKKYPSNGFSNKVCNLVNFANRGWGFAYMQTFPPLCIYNFGLPHRTPSPRPPPRAISLRPSALPAARARPPAAARARRTRPRLDDIRGHSAGTEMDLLSRGPSLGGGRRGAELTRTTTAMNAAWVGRRPVRRPGLGGNWQRPGLGGDWHARRTSKWREGKKTRGRDRWKKNSEWSPHFRFTKSKCKVL